MLEISPDLFIGTIADIGRMPLTVNLSSKWHKAQHPDLNPQHHCYIIHEDPTLLSVNWVDGPAAYFDYQGQGVNTCERILDFLSRHKDQPRLIVCDQGMSRSPSIAMLYLAKRHYGEAIGYDKAYEIIKLLYPTYNPGSGITEFLKNNWNDIS